MNLTLSLRGESRAAYADVYVMCVGANLFDRYCIDLLVQLACACVNGRIDMEGMDEDEDEEGEDDMEDQAEEASEDRGGEELKDGESANGTLVSCVL